MAAEGGFSDLRQHKEPLFAPISATAAGANTVVAADPLRRIKVTQYTLVASADNTVTWKSAATALSGGMSIIASGGIASPCSTPAQGALFQTEVGEALVLSLSAATPVTGHLSYFLEP